MPKNLAEQLGFAPDAKVAVIHTDDIGMCHAANTGAFETLEQGVASCGSIMVPCPWFAEAAERARANPELDLGVHLTLNSEWEHYRWGPVAGRSAVPSLVADDGRLPRTSLEVLQNAKPEEVEVELRAQVQAALDAGVDVTHIDAHMGTAFFPPFLPIYSKIAREFRVPAFIVRPHRAQLEAAGPGMNALEAILKEVDGLAADGFPVLDAFDPNSLDFERGTGAAHNEGRLAGFRPGVTYLICHPATGGEELETITPDSAHARDFERQHWAGSSGREMLERQGVQTVGMRPLRDLLRG